MNQEVLSSGKGTKKGSPWSWKFRDTENNLCGICMWKNENLDTQQGNEVEFYVLFFWPRGNDVSLLDLDRGLISVLSGLQGYNRTTFGHVCEGVSRDIYLREEEPP